ncbi:MAG: hypothetical protein J5I47_12655 [Vicingus serpentipes]|nr:hypothetical protein [Vicingus serpentipes]
MNRAIKLIWDFKGDEAKEIAKHHVVHINEFAIKENIELVASGIDTINEMHTIAYMVVIEPQMIAVRDALKPHRGELYDI